MKQTLQPVFSLIKCFWQNCNGETAYQRYLLHWQQHHADGHRQPLSRKAFFAAETQRKWNGIKRCC
ncbi:MAG: hypothetical protein CTY19_06600 [Methylomonas sp.]|jgi:uncharacterized short protein YbdD (DUF466 family)|nr:MAG: hypothetical protein CTY19_06600 [Methylomonas sp.]